MSYADRVKDVTTSTGAGNITVSGTPSARCFPFSGLAVGSKHAIVIEGQGTSTEIEVSICTILSATTFSRDTVITSSNADALVNFSAGTKDVFCTVPASQLNKMAAVLTVAFATAIPLTGIGATYMPQQTVSAVLAFTVGASPVQGALVYVRLIADGTNAPTFTGFKEWGGSLGYDNRNGIVNEVQFFYDGYDSWYSISQAVGAVAVAPAASAVTLARSAASGVVGTGVTITVGTNSPLTGAQTQSVALSSNVAGTWSVNPVALSAGTATATSVFTPSATGSATITGTATGTPTLTNGTIGYTSNAAATVPAAPTIGIAVAGDGYVDVAFTHNSDGGASVIDSTATLSTGETATGTTSPIRVTAANGTARTATVKDRNSVGQSAASAASNSVTPVPTGPLRALAGFTMLTESGSDPNWAYAGTGGGAFDATGAVFNKGLASNALGSFSCVRATAASLSIQPALSAIAGTSPLALASRVGTLLHGSGGPYMVYLGSSSQTVANTVNALVGDWLRIRRSATTTLVYEVSQDGGSTWITIFTQTGAPSTALNFQLQIIGPGASLVNGLTGVGLS
jgi:hypothetical protein